MLIFIELYLIYATKNPKADLPWDFSLFYKYVSAGSFLVVVLTFESVDAIIRLNSGLRRERGVFSFNIESHTSLT